MTIQQASHSRRPGREAPDQQPLITSVSRTLFDRAMCKKTPQREFFCLFERLTQRDMLGRMRT